MNTFARSMVLVFVGVAGGFLAGMNVHASSAASSIRPIDGWTRHTDVDHHFPNHPQLLAHHWCKQITAALSECQLYDSDGPNAKLIGVEPIVSDTTFRTFSASEQRMWHWHKTSTSRIVVPGGTPEQNAQANQHRGTTHGKTILLWDPWDTVDPVGIPRVIPH